MSDLDKAREWANEIYAPSPGCQAAVEIIQSLPDQWVDAENVQAMIDNYKHARDANAPGAEGWVINHLMVSNLESLIPPSKLPTLANMTQEEREACQWMQCKLQDSDDDFVLLHTESPEFAKLLHRSTGTTWDVEMKKVTPLPGPKLQWPGGGDTPTISNKEKVAGDQAVAKDVCNSEPNSSETPKSSIKPDDVIPNQPWLVEINGEKYVGTRFSGVGIFHPWAVAALDGAETFSCDDMAITLIHKLVPEPPALPEGMRLADHAEYGRIVVSQRADEDGDYAFFESIPGGIAGASWGYVNKSELTFLGGDKK